MTPQKLKRNNIILLACLLIAIAVFPIIQPQRALFRNLVLATIVLSSIFCLDFRKETLRILRPIGLVVILLLVLSNFLGSDFLNILDYSATFLFLVLIVVSIIRYIAREKEVDATIIISSINGYLLMGVLWSLLLHSTYILESRILADTPAILFPGSVQPGYQDFIYFTFVTMTTLGYGDILPVSEISRSITLLISISGQFYMTLLVALLVGKYIANKKDD
jgi:voltage-gated potassium channel